MTGLVGFEGVIDAFNVDELKRFDLVFTIADDEGNLCRTVKVFIRYEFKFITNLFNYSVWTSWVSFNK